jgi:hypothetical protein
VLRDPSLYPATDLVVDLAVQTERGHGAGDDRHRHDPFETKPTEVDRTRENEKSPPWQTNG